MTLCKPLTSALVASCLVFMAAATTQVLAQPDDSPAFVDKRGRPLEGDRDGARGDRVTKYYALLIANDEGQPQNDDVEEMMKNFDSWKTGASLIKQDHRAGVRILKDIEDWVKNIDGDDVAVFWYIGHGGLNKGDPDADETPNTDPDADNDNKRKVDHQLCRLADPLKLDVTEDQVANALGVLPASTTLLTIFNMCYANDASLGTEDVNLLINTAVLVSCAEAKKSYRRGYKWIWTEKVLKGLDDGADANDDADADQNGDGEITVQELFNWAEVQDSATQLNSNLDAGANRPIFVGFNDDEDASEPGIPDKPTGKEGSGCCSRYDCGDLPDTYRTLITGGGDGPRYNEWVMQRLGARVDGEEDGQPRSYADGDDTDVEGDDEDGVVFGPNYVRVTVRIDHPDPHDYRLDAWFDLDNLGTFDEPTEHLIASHDGSSLNGLLSGLSTGTYVYTYSTSGFDPRDVFSRFRLTFGVPTSQIIAHYGETDKSDGGSHGEVEDYAPCVGCPTDPCGACCHADGTCVDEVTQEVCSGLDGTYFGDETACIDFTCDPAPTGACCWAEDGACAAELTEDLCNLADGYYLGLETVCLGDSNENGIDDACEHECGNNIREAWEECDGTDDSACPGKCFPPGDLQECTCRHITFAQTDFEQGAYSVEDSAWGHVELEFVGTSGFQYFNLVVDGVWEIQNAPLWSSEGVGVTHTMGLIFDLHITPPEEVPSLTYIADLGGAPLASAPTGTPTDATVGEIDVTVGGRGEEFGPIPPPVPIQRPAEFAIVDSAFNFGMVNQDCGVNECVPAAFSNSLNWLDDQNEDVNIPAGQKSIAGLKGPTNWSAAGCPSDNSDWQGKKESVKDHVTTRKLTMAQIDAVIDELEDDQDVELFGPHHGAVVTGIVKFSDGDYVIEVAHDTAQDQPGGTEEQMLIYNSNTGLVTAGVYGFNPGQELDWFVVECPLRESILPCPENSLSEQPVQGQDSDYWYASASDEASGVTWCEDFEEVWGDVCDIHFWGLIHDNVTGMDCTEDPMTFEIKFFQDDAVTQIGTTYTLPISPVDTFHVYDPDPETAGDEMILWEFSADLTPWVPLFSGAEKTGSGWVSIRAMGTNDCLFYWAAADVCGPDAFSILWDEDTQAFYYDSVDWSLCLTGEEGSPILGACCYEPTSDCLQGEMTSCTGSGYRFEPYTLCAELDPPCGEIEGACCDPDTGRCTYETQTDCLAAGGDFTAHGDCYPNTCPQPDPCDGPTVIYAQTPYDDDPDTTPLNYRNYGGSAVITAADVLLEADTEITDFHWWAADEDCFQWSGFADVLIYNDLAGEPGTTLVVELLDIPNHQAFYNGETIWGGEREVKIYTIDLGEPDTPGAFELAAGIYWIGMRPVGMLYDSSAMMVTSAAIGAPYRQKWDDEPDWELEGDDPDIAFCLTSAESDPNCPGDIVGATPADGTIDARIPHVITSTVPCYGFGMPDNPATGVDESLQYPIIIDVGTAGADAGCWALCETPDMSASPCGSNDIAGVTDNGDGTYTIALAHGVAAGTVTTIQYNGLSYVSYIHHPANVDANYAGSTVSNANDITEMVNCLSGSCENYEADMDSSGSQGAGDITVVIDVLNGAQAYDPWVNTDLPVNTGDCP